MSRPPTLVAARRDPAEHLTVDLGQAATLVAPTTAPLQAVAAQGSFAVYSERFSLRTADATPAFFDITELACAITERCGITHGTLTASTRHTTCAIVVQESEPLLLSDMADRLRRYASADEVYRHNDFDVRTVNMCDGECANGHAHCQHLLLGASVTLPVQQGELVLGLWQRLFLVELDRARLRHYSIQVMGVRQADDRAE
jgi:secondary thiamine-phosphate synthase enzyme